MRRFCRTLIPAMLAAAVAAGCATGENPDRPTPTASGRSSTPPTTDADLVIWTDAVRIAGIKQVADAFAAEKGITVKVQAISENLPAQFLNAQQTGNGPDVVVGAHDSIGNLVLNGAIVPVPADPADLAGYSDAAVQATTYEGRLYGIPYGMEALALYRNTAVAPAQPKTLDDAIAAGRAAVKAGKVDAALNLPVGAAGDAFHLQPLLTSMGGYLFGYDPATGYDPADIGIGGPGSIAAAQKISQLAKAGVLRSSIDGGNNIPLFADGKAAFMVSGPWALAILKDSGVEYAVQPIPGFAGHEAAQPFLGVQAFMIAAEANNLPLAQEFVTVGVNSESAMTTLFEATRLPPAMVAVQEQVQDEDLAALTDAANAAAPVPAFPTMVRVWGPLGKAYSAIVGGADPRQSMKRAETAIRDATAGG